METKNEKQLFLFKTLPLSAKSYNDEIPIRSGPLNFFEEKLVLNSNAEKYRSTLCATNNPESTNNPHGLLTS